MDAIKFIKSIKHLLVGAHLQNADKVIYEATDEGCIKGMIERLPEANDTCLYMGYNLSKANLSSHEWSKVYSEIVRHLNSDYEKNYGGLGSSHARIKTAERDV